MGKKKQSQQHVQQSMASMVNRAALAQMGPQIDSMVRGYVNQAANQLAQQQSSTLETLFARVVVLEQVLIEKLGMTGDELVSRVADLEDSKEDLSRVETAELGDVVRIEVRTKTSDQAEFQGSSRLKIYDTGSGQTIGNELEPAIIGMKAGESKTVNFGKDGSMVAELKVDRVSRANKKEEAQSGDSAQG